MLTKLISTEEHPEDTFTLRLERGDFVFLPGHHVHLGFPGDTITREYSVASAPEERHLDILVRRIESGYLTPLLCNLVPGTELSVTGPYGEFLLQDAPKHHLIATGTGIAPFLSYAAARTDLSYDVTHGVAQVSETWVQDRFPRDAYRSCVTRSAGGDFSGRVTDYWRQTSVDVHDHFYLCGRTDMIYELFAILTQKGVPRASISAEIYY